MKRLFSLLLTAVMLCSVLALFAVPVSAEDFATITGTEEITENADFLSLAIDSGAKATVKSGVTLTVRALMNSGTLIIEPGATVIAQFGFSNAPDAFLEIGGKLTSGDDSSLRWMSYMFMGNITIKSGGIIDAAIDSDKYASITLNDLKENCVHISGSRLTVHSSHDMIDRVCSRCGKSACDINGESHLFQNGKCTRCGYVCENSFHRNSGECPECGMSVNFTAGSVFSDGGITIIVGFAGILIGMAIMFLIMKKKKPATVNGAADENSDEEDE